MKINIVLICVVVMTAIYCRGQDIYGLTDQQRVGAYVRTIKEPSPQDKKIMAINTMRGGFVRVVNGKIYNIIQNTSWIGIINASMYSYQKGDNVTILDEISAGAMGRSHHYMAFTNYSGGETVGQWVTTLAMRIGNYDMGGTPIELYDCGTLYIPPPPTPEQIAAAQDAAKKATLREKQKQFMAQSNAVVWLQSQATNGSASSQESLGEHYLSGIGCETNRALGIYWLQQATAQGDIEASNKLSVLMR